MKELLKRSIPIQIKKRIPKQWKINYEYYTANNKALFPYSKGDLKIFVALAADYGNLGDLAITKSQMEFLKHFFPNHRVIKILLSDTFSLLKEMKKRMNENDIITIIGGGNMGDLYNGFEEKRRTIIEYFPNNRIISFPQTIDFSESEAGNAALIKTKNSYAKHKDLHIFAREPISYKIMKTTFSHNKVYLVPDIVLFTKRIEPILKRETILVCLRDDLERNVDKNFKRDLTKLLKGLGETVINYDTHIGDVEITDHVIEEELTNIWSAFKSSKVVVTDRLHGMIFCAITKTPCIVFPNSNHKIIGSYNRWLKDSDFIKLMNPTDIKEVKQGLDELTAINLNNCKEIDLEEDFKPLINVFQ